MVHGVGLIGVESEGDSPLGWGLHVLLRSHACICAREEDRGVRKCMPVAQGGSRPLRYDQCLHNRCTWVQVLYVLCIMRVLRYVAEEGVWEFIGYHSRSGSALYLEGYPGSIITAGHNLEIYDWKSGLHYIAEGVLVTSWPDLATVAYSQRSSTRALEAAGGVWAEGYQQSHRTVQFRDDHHVLRLNVAFHQYGPDAAILRVPGLFAQNGPLHHTPPLRSAMHGFRSHPDDMGRAGLVLGTPAAGPVVMSNPVYTLLVPTSSYIDFPPIGEYLQEAGYGGPGMSGGPLVVPGVSSSLLDLKRFICSSATLSLHCR